MYIYTHINGNINTTIDNQNIDGVDTINLTPTHTS